MSMRETMWMVSDFFRAVVGFVRFVVRAFRWCWWLVSGAELDGKPRTDAGWLTPGTNALTRTGRAPKRSYRPRAHRAGIRWGVFLVLVLTYYLMGPVPWLVYFLYFVGLVAAIWFWSRRLWAAWRRRRFDDQVVRPLYQAIGKILGANLYQPQEMSRLLIVPVNYQTDPDMRIVLALPLNFGGDASVQTAISRVVSQKLGVELDGHWSHVGEPYVEWTHKPKPPPSVDFNSIIDQLDEMEDDEILLGLGSRGENVSVSMNKHPHVGMSIDTGGGKSSTLRGMLAQQRRRGAELVICDPGGGSLPEFEGIPGVTIVTETQDIWDMVDRFEAEMERRYSVLRTDPKAKFRRLILTLEEANALYLKSIELWQEVKAKQDPAVPPLYRRLAGIMIRARKVNMNVWAVYQYMEARYAGGAVYGPLIRSQFNVKILARYSVNVWKFLVGLFPMVRSSSHMGRGVVIIGSDVRQTQLAYWTPEEARAYALGDETPSSVTSEEIIARLREEGEAVTDVTPRPSLTVIQGGAAQNDADQAVEDDSEPVENDDDVQIREGATLASPARRYTLAELAREKIVPLSYGALRQAKSTAKTKGWYFPAGRTIDGVTKYTEREVKKWYENRQQPASGE